MFKSSKTAVFSSILGIGAAIVFTNTAFAYSDMKSTYCKPGFYAGIEAGWDNTHYGVADVLSEVQTTAQNSSPPGGLSFTRVPAYGSNFVNGNVDDQGMGGRLFAGYQFNPYLAVEAGYTQFHKTTFVAASSYRYITGGSQFSSSQTTSNISSFNQYSGELTEYAGDLVGKLTYPMQYGFGVFLKAGAAFVAADRHINTTTIYNNGSAIPQSTFYTKSYQAVRPTYGAGIDYSIPSTSLDVSVAFTEIAGGGGIPRADLVSLGISEKFA